MLIDKLLQADVKEMSAMPTGEIEIKRLSEKFGEPFKMQLRGIRYKRFMEIQEFNTNEVEKEIYNEKTGKYEKQKLKETDGYQMTIDMIAEGTIDPPFKDGRLLEKWHTPSPNEIIEQMFTVNELNEIAVKIAELSGVDKQKLQAEIDKQIKNS